MHRPGPGSLKGTAAAVVAGALIVSAWGCASLRDSRTQWPVKEYEKIIAGRLDADYVGNAACTAKCHAHDAIARDFRLSIHGEQVAADTGLPLVNCESCHGPGSLAIANIKDDKCDFSTFIDLEKIPSGARSLICLKCHAKQSLESVSAWSGSRHDLAGVSCVDCHKLHKGPAQRVARSEITALCSSCHRAQAVAFSLPSHHPVPEGDMTCADCHDPHGTLNDADLKASPVRELCARCHANKTGPFVYEHADITADCQSCHEVHGSPNRQMTRWAQPFLCLQCHNGHNGSRRSVFEKGDEVTKAVFYGDCTGCHTQIHGSDLQGYGLDDRFTR
jgi:DmsE family decaheme c-type cytochrome